MTATLLTILQSSLALAVSKTLLHFLWQGTLVALAARGLRKQSPALRYGVFVTAFFLMALCPPVAMTTEIPTLPQPAVSLAPVPANAMPPSVKTIALPPALTPSLLDRLRTYDYSRARLLR